MSKGRPGGNPDLVEYQFSTDRDESCSAKLTLRLQPSQYEKLKKLPEWQEKTREAIANLLEETQLDSSTTQNATATKPAGTTGEGS